MSQVQETRPPCKGLSGSSGGTRPNQSQSTVLVLSRLRPPSARLLEEKDRSGTSQGTKPAPAGKLKTTNQTEAVGVVRKDETRVRSINLAGSPKCIVFKVGKQRYRSLIDTGAEVSLISEVAYSKLVPKPKIVRDSLHLQSVSGQSLDVKGKAEITFTVGDNSFSHQFYVVAGLSRNFILGNDWLDKNGVRIYFDLKKIRVGTVYIPYEQDIHIASIVRTTKTKVLKPQTATVCYVRMKDSPYFETDQELEVSGTDKGFLAEEPGVIVTNTLVKHSAQRKFPLLIVNNTNKTIKIKRGCVVGQVAPVNDVRPFTVGSVEETDAVKEETKIDAPEEFRSTVEKLVQRNAELFASCDLDLGRTQTVQMKIETGNHPPIRMKPYRVSLQDREVVDTVLDENVRNRSLIDIEKAREHVEAAQTNLGFNEKSHILCCILCCITSMFD